VNSHRSHVLPKNIYRITRDPSATGGYWFALISPRTGKAILHTHSKSFVPPAEMLKLQARYNTNLILDGVI